MEQIHPVSRRQQKMTKQLKPYILIVMLAAVLLIVFCLSEYISLGRRLSSLYSQLDESTEKWSRTAAEKETLQVDLKAKQKELNIAQLDLNELTEDADAIKAEIEQLRSEIEILKQSRSSDQ